MNFSSSSTSMSYINNSSKVNVESWFIPLDIFMILCSILIIKLAILFLFIIIFDKTCHTIPMMLIANTCLIAFILGCCLLSLCIFTLENDLKQISYQDSFCIVRAYAVYVAYALLNCSFLLQALYRYVLVIYPTRLFWRSVRFQTLAIYLTYIYSFVYIIPFRYTGDMIYNVDNQICQLILRFSFSIIYGACSGYGLPISLVVFIYFKLVRYVKEMNKNVTVLNTLIRAQRELKMVQRTVILIIILIGIAFPYILMMFMAFFNRAPKYHYRIAYIFVNASTVSVMITLFQFTDPLKTFVMNKIKRRPNVVVGTMT